MTDRSTCGSADACTPPPAVDAARLFREHRTALLAYLRRRLPRGGDPDDALQEVFVRVLRTASRPECEACTPRWLWGIARNVAADAHRRRGRRERETPLGALPAEPRAAAPDVHEHVLSWLRPAVQRLPETYREAVRLADIERLPQAEVARRLGVSLSGAKSRVQRARALLAERLRRCCEIELGPDGRAVDFRRRDCDC